MVNRLQFNSHLRPRNLDHSSMKVTAWKRADPPFQRDTTSLESSTTLLTREPVQKRSNSKQIPSLRKKLRW